MGTLGTAGTASEPFAWMQDRGSRRGSLAAVHQAVRHRWLSGDGPGLAERRATLMTRLFAVLDDPATSWRERVHILRIFATMAKSDAGVER
jgi:hypothetical protein